MSPVDYPSPKESSDPPHLVGRSLDEVLSQCNSLPESHCRTLSPSNLPIYNYEMYSFGRLVCVEYGGVPQCLVTTHQGRLVVYPIQEGVIQSPKTHERRIDEGDVRFHISPTTPGQFTIFLLPKAEKEAILTAYLNLPSEIGDPKRELIPEAVRVGMDRAANRLAHEAAIRLLDETFPSGTSLLDLFQRAMKEDSNPQKAVLTSESPPLEIPVHPSTQAFGLRLERGEIEVVFCVVPEERGARLMAMWQDDEGIPRFASSCGQLTVGRKRDKDVPLPVNLRHFSGDHCTVRLVRKEDGSLVVRVAQQGQNPSEILLCRDFISKNLRFPPQKG